MFKLISILLVLCTSLISAQKAGLPEETPPDFNIYVEGVYEFINTFDSAFTLTYLKDTLITIDMVFSTKQMDTIYREMKNIDIFYYPDKYYPPYKDNPEPGIGKSSHPFSKYILKIYANGLEKNIYWTDNNFSKAKKAVKLRRFIHLVLEIARNHKAYKELNDRWRIDYPYRL